MCVSERVMMDRGSMDRGGVGVATVAAIHFFAVDFRIRNETLVDRFENADVARWHDGWKYSFRVDKKRVY